MSSSRDEYDQNPKVCVYCGAVIPYNRRTNKFCNSSCAAKYNNKKRVESGWVRSEESKLRTSNSIKTSIAQLVLAPCKKCGKLIHVKRNNINNTLCDECRKTPHTVNRICVICGKHFIAKSPTYRVKTCSMQCRNQLQYNTKKANNSHNGGGYRMNSNKQYSGYYNDIWCESRWELAFLVYHLDNKIEISRNTQYFNYVDDNNISHKYYPDFIVNGEFIEIKGRWKQNLDKKLQSVIDAGFKIKLLQKCDISMYLNYCYKKYNTKNLSILYDLSQN